MYSIKSFLCHNIQWFGRVVNHVDDNNLFFGLRGDGSSMALVTDFLYTIHHEPETRSVRSKDGNYKPYLTHMPKEILFTNIRVLNPRPAIVLIWLQSEADVENMMKV